MDSARWEQIQAVFHSVADRPASEQQSFLEAACAGDAELLARVRAMLEADRGSVSLLDRGLPDVAYRMLGAPVESFPFQEVGPYRLKQILGQGGMGVVYLAEREDTGAPVAIKFLLHAGMSAPRRESFAREIKTLARLKHPFIARLYDAGSLADGTPWFVMEYVEGIRLTDYCREHQLSVDDQVRLLRSVCEAVQYAYRQGIIHRDLKPSNILVEKDGTPRLLDFGIARQLQNPEEGEQSPSGLRFGSAEYAAPEWTREGIVGSYTDVYSLGVMLYEMLAGRRAATPDEDLPLSLAVGKSAWHDLNALCVKARHPDISRRYQSVEELKLDVDHYLNCEPLNARGRRWNYRAGKFVRRNRRAVLAATLMLALVAGLVVFFTVRLAKARNAALAEAARSKTIEQFMVNLFESGTPETAPSKDLRAITILDRGARQAETLKADPETQAELYQTLGTIYDTLGRFQESDRLLRLALDRMRTAVGPEHPKVAEVLLKMSVLSGDRSQPKDALRFAQDGLALAERHAAPDDPAVIEAKSVVGRVTAQSGSFKQAITILEPLVAAQPLGEVATYNLADNLSVLGVCYYELGNLQTAESLDRRALALHRQVAGEFHPHTANDLLNLAEVKAGLGQYAEAEKYFRSAIATMEGWYGRDHPDTATYMGIFARTLLFEGKTAEAKEMLKQVLQVQERAYGSADVRISVTLDSLGKIAIRRGDLTAAQADLSRGLKMAQSIFGEANAVTATLKADLGDVHVRQGQYAIATQELGEALKVLTATRPPGDSHIGAAELSLGRSLLRQRQYVDAEKQLSAGYRILSKQAHPPPDRLLEARQDLAAVYQLLRDPDKASKYQAELAASVRN